MFLLHVSKTEDVGNGVFIKPDVAVLGNVSLGAVDLGSGICG